MLFICQISQLCQNEVVYCFLVSGYCIFYNYKTLYGKYDPDYVLSCFGCAQFQPCPVLFWLRTVSTTPNLINQTKLFFLMLALLRRTFFLTTFYGLYFSHHCTHITNYNLSLIFLFIQNKNHGPKRDLIHRSREKSIIRPLLYHQATMAGYLCDQLSVPLCMEVRSNQHQEQQPHP